MSFQGSKKSTENRQPSTITLILQQEKPEKTKKSTKTMEESHMNLNNIFSFEALQSTYANIPILIEKLYIFHNFSKALEKYSLALSSSSSQSRIHTFCCSHRHHYSLPWSYSTAAIRVSINIGTFSFPNFIDRFFAQSGWGREEDKNRRDRVIVWSVVWRMEMLAGDLHISEIFTRKFLPFGVMITSNSGHRIAIANGKCMFRCHHT